MLIRTERLDVESIKRSEVAGMNIETLLHPPTKTHIKTGGALVIVKK